MPALPTDNEEAHGSHYTNSCDIRKCLNAVKVNISVLSDEVVQELYKIAKTEISQRDRPNSPSRSNSPASSDSDITED